MPIAGLFERDLESNSHFLCFLSVGCYVNSESLSLTASLTFPICCCPSAQATVSQAPGARVTEDDKGCCYLCEVVSSFLMSTHLQTRQGQDKVTRDKDGKRRGRTNKEDRTR